MTAMTDTRAPRPTDLVALVTFDDEVRENLAVTREHLTEPPSAARPLSAAIDQWLHLGRRTWICLAGREIRGIATARDLSARHAWQIDALIDAEASEGGPAIIGDLLRQASVAAAEAEVTHLVLRTPEGSPAQEDAPRAGFRPVVLERLWLGRLTSPSPSAEVAVREATPADTSAMFHVYSRSWPVEARQALAMTLDEWTALQEHRWIERGSVVVAEQAGQVVAFARTSRTGQFTLTVTPGAAAAADALLGAIAARLEESDRHLALVPASGVEEEAALRRAGLEPERTFALFCKRIARPVREEAYARAGVPITG